jgi:uncharacterized RmlC-like cupin family protein
MHVLTIAPGGRAKAHLHAHYETAIYVLSGASEVWYGEDLQEHLVTRAGNFLVHKVLPSGETTGNCCRHDAAQVVRPRRPTFWD